MTIIRSPSPFVQAKVDGVIGWLILNRPERKNALNGDMWGAIPPLLDALVKQPGVKVIVLRGVNAEAFAAGADISEFASSRFNAEAAQAYEQMNTHAMAAIRTCALPTIALIQGFCVGGGVSLALSCDLRFSDASGIFALPPARLGLAYPMAGIRDLLATVSPPIAKEMIYTARRLNAAEAAQAGLINAVADDVEAHVRQIAASIADNAPLTIRASKAAIDHAAGRLGAPSLVEVAELTTACFNSDDYREGQAAFLEKRKPRFTGR
jgi:enoyl-CoA hydratase/carnithine racemase